MYVYLDLSQDTSHPESQVHHDLLVEELVEELRDRAAFLERSLERRSLEAERYQQIVAGLTQTNNLSTRVLELEAPAQQPTPCQPNEEAAPEQAEEGSVIRAVSELVAVVSASTLVGGEIGMLAGVALGAFNPLALGIICAAAGTCVPVLLAAAVGTRGAARGPWWRRWFGG